MNCLIYSRVSTEDQAEKGRSIEDQIKICGRFAKDNGYEMAGVYKDPGKSATNMNRPGLQDLILRCQEDKNIEAVLVLDTDRLARNAADHLKIKAILKKAGTRVISVSQPMLDDSQPEGAFIDLVIAGANALQSQITGRKVLKTLKEKFREGWFPGVAHLGYKNVNIGTEQKPNRIIEIDEKKAPFIKRGYELFATGLYSAEKLNDILYRKGFTTKYGKKLSSSEINRVLQNPFYYGLMRFDGEERIGKHESIITKELFEQCQQVFEEHNHRANRERKYDFLLRGFVVCGICGHRLTAEHHFSVNKSYYHCISKGAHSNKKQNISVELLERRVEQLFEQIQLPQSLIDKILIKAKEILSKTHDEIDKDKRLLMLRKVQLENKREVLENKFLEGKGVISNDTYKRQHTAIEQELASINDQINDSESDRKSNINVFEKLLILARDIGTAYKEASPQIKKHYLGLFWERIEVKDRKIKKAVPTKLYAELFPNYNFSLTSNRLSNHKIITNDRWRVHWDSNPGHAA